MADSISCLRELRHRKQWNNPCLFYFPRQSIL